MYKLFIVFLRFQSFLFAFLVLLFTFTQLAFLASLLLPWKLLVIVSVQDIPFTLKGFAENATLDEWIIGLSASILIAFILYFFSLWLMGFLVKKGADRLLELHQKSGLFNNHRTTAHKLYEQITQSAGIILFLLLAFVFFLIFYPYILLPLGVFGLLVLTLYLGHTLYQNRVKPIALNQAWLQKFGWHAGFIFVLAWIIIDVIWSQGIDSLIIVFISLILARQVLLYSFHLFFQIKLINKNNKTIQTLFNPDVAWVSGNYELKKFKGVMEKITHPATRIDALSELLKDLNLGPIVEANCRPAYSGNLNYVRLNITDDVEKSTVYVLKVYDLSLESKAEHEKILLEQTFEAAPFPKLVAFDKTKDVFWMLLSWPIGGVELTSPQRKKEQPLLKTRLLSLILSDDLINQQGRSKASLLDRLLMIDLEGLVKYANEFQQIEVCNWLAANRLRLLNSLNLHPKELVLPNILSRVIAKNTTESPLIYNLTDWHWDWIGCEWSAGSDIKTIRKILDEATTLRPELSEVKAESVKLVALLYAFDQAYAKQDFTSALNQLQRIYEYVQNHIDLGINLPS